MQQKLYDVLFNLVTINSILFYCPSITVV